MRKTARTIATEEDADAWNTGGSQPEIAIGWIAGDPDPNKWNFWVTQQDSVWVDRDNKVFLIDDMSPRYAFNVLKFLFRVHRADIGNPFANPLVRALVMRLDKEYQEELRKLSKEEQIFLPNTAWGDKSAD